MTNVTDFRNPVKTAKDELRLPDDLRLLALEYTFNGDTVVEEAIQIALQNIGLCSASSYAPGEKTIFGSAYKHRIRVDIVTTRVDVERWGKQPKFAKNGGDIFWSNSGGLGNVQCTGVKVVDRVSTENDEEHGWDGSFLDDGEDLITLIRKQVQTEQAGHLKEFWQLKQAYNHDIVAVGKHIQNSEDEYFRTPEAPEFVVEGLIAKDGYTLLLGVTGIGKGALLLQLACDVAMGKPDWLGHRINPPRGLVVMLYGEDSPAEMKRRVGLLCDKYPPPLLRLVRYNGQPIKELLAEFKNAKVDLLIIDPARKFVEGDEDGSDAVNKFFIDIDPFLAKTKAAIVMAHHCRRGATPRNVNEVPDHMRGSQVFLDRPRVVLAMHRGGDVTSFGIPLTPAGPRHNMDVAVMVKGVMRLKRDEPTFRHVVITKEAPSSSDEGIESVRAALARFAGEGRSITGADLLIELHPPELEGMSRTAVRMAFRLLSVGPK
jgi:hypothetical protein